MKHLRLTAALFLSFFSAPAALVVLAPALPAIAGAFDTSVAQAGQLRSAAAIGGAVMAIALTPLARRIGIRPHTPHRGAGTRAHDAALPQCHS